MDNNQTATHQVVTTILSGIEKGTFKLGQRIPSQRELSKLFGVSRMVIREAIKILEGRGFLVSKQGSGIYVQQEVAKQEALSLGSLQEYPLGDVYSLANSIWESCMDLVIQNATDEELSELMLRSKELYDNYSSVTSQQTKYLYESSFGMTIAKLTHNRLLYRLMIELLNVTSDIDYQVVKNNSNYKFIVEIDLHLLESLIQRDAYRAKFWAKERDIAIGKVINGQESLRKQL